jgi:hypothetical protein
MKAMLRPLPQTDQERVLRLREYFRDLHCPDSAFRELDAGKRGVKNLQCSLPGSSAEQIVIAARYDQPHAEWNSAVVLPILYHAMTASPRRHTFVFTAMAGVAGQKAFLSELKVQGHEPSAIIFLDMLGLGLPAFTARSTRPLSSKGRESEKTRKTLANEAKEALRRSGVPDLSQPEPTVTGSTLTMTGPETTATGEDVLFEADKIPAIVFYSVTGSATPAGANAMTSEDRADMMFKQNFEFLAYYLGRIDSALVPAEP